MSTQKVALSATLLVKISKALEAHATTWALATMNEYAIPPALRKALLSRAQIGASKRACLVDQYLLKGSKLADLPERVRLQVRTKMAAQLPPNTCPRVMPTPKSRSIGSRRSISRVPHHSRPSARRYASSMPVNRLSSSALS